jgi:hypothetical protein
MLPALLLLANLAADAGAPAFEVREESYETFVKARPPGAACPAWEWRRKSRQLRLHRCPGQTLAEDTPPLRALLVRLAEQEGPAIADGSLLLVWVRLVP